MRLITKAEICIVNNYYVSLRRVVLDPRLVGYRGFRGLAVQAEGFFNPPRSGFWIPAELCICVVVTSGIWRKLTDLRHGQDADYCLGRALSVRLCGGAYKVGQ